MNCDTTRELFSEFYDGGLTPSERHALEDHLKSCSNCTGEYGQFSTSLKVLRDSRKMETTQVFLANLRRAAEEHLEESGRIARAAAPPPAAPAPAPAAVPARRVTPVWVPFMLAGAALGAFAIGFLLRSRDVADLQARMDKLVNERPREVVEVPKPVDEEKILAGRGLVQVDGRWIPSDYRDAFAAGKVLLDGKAVSRREAALALKGELPEPPPPEVKPEPVPPAPTEKEILDKHGLVQVKGVLVPRAWLARWADGKVLTGPGTWITRDALREEFMKTHDLVEHEGRVMTRERAEEIRARATVRRPEKAPGNNAVTRRLEGLRIGAPASYLGLTVYPLIGPKGGKAPAILTLQEALGVGKLQLRDRSGSFFTVEADNKAEQDVLLLAGEVLTGGRCNRVVAVDTRVAAGTKAEVPVACVQPGTWGRGDAFDKACGHYVAPPAIRAALVAEQGQGAVWSALAGTEGLVAQFRAEAGTLIEYRAFFDGLAEREPAAIGIVLAVGGDVVAAELFADHAMWAAYNHRLVRAAAIEAAKRGAGRERRAPAAYPNTPAGVKRFLERAFLLAYDPREGGTLLRGGKARLGRALLGKAGVVHLLLFADAPAEPDLRTRPEVPAAKLRRAVAEIERRIKRAGPAGKEADLQELAGIPGSDALALLVRMLGDSNDPVRRAAARHLGTRGDVRAADPLLQVVKRARQDLPLFTEAVRALARLGIPAAVDPLVKQMEAGGPDRARVVLEALPELLLQVRTPDTLRDATGRLLSAWEAYDAAARGIGTPDPRVRTMKPGEAGPLAEAARRALVQLTGRDEPTAAAFRAWWNERANRERFLRERTGR